MSLVLADVQPTESPRITEITVLKEFDGMTNGEVIKALFPEIDTHDFGITIHATERVTCCGDKHCRGSISYDFWKEWWNAPYKAESEDNG